MQQNKFRILSEYIEFFAQKNGEKTAVIYDNVKLTYCELEKQTNQFAAFISSLDIVPGDRVILKLENSIRFVIAFFGCIKSGLICVPIHPATPNKKLEYIVKNCKASLCITNSRIDSEDELPIRSFIYTEEDDFVSEPIPSYRWNQVMNSKAIYEKREISEKETAVIIYTSGTTGDPKGVVEPHENILFVVDAINKELKNSDTDVILCGLPLSFDYGLYQLFLSFSAGATLVLVNDFSVPMAIPKILKDYHITGFPLVPSIAAALLNSRLLDRIQLPDLRYITSTGDIFPLAHIDALKSLLDHVKIFPMYGLTECKRVSILTESENIKYRASVGKPLTGTEVYVIDHDGEKLPPNHIGELVIEGNHVMNGYWEDREETDQKFYFDLDSGKKRLYSGDLFQMNEEGYLYYIGRNELVIKCRGFRVSPIQIENVIYDMKGIKEVCIFGVENEHMGQEITGVVVSEEASITEGDIVTHCKNYLERETIPKNLIISQEPLPKTKNGKIDRQYIKHNYCRQKATLEKVK